MSKLEWVPTNMIGGKKWYLYAYTGDGVTRGRKFKEVVMYLSAHHRVSSTKKRVFIGWDVYRIRPDNQKVGPRIFRLKKAQDFAEMIWRMG
jgi:hypothetical protein